MKNEQNSTTGGIPAGQKLTVGGQEIGRKYPGAEAPCCSVVGTDEPGILHIYGNDEDNWEHRADNMLCKGCMFWVRKRRLAPMQLGQPWPGRCRRHAPTMRGWPVVFETDWCGDHKLDENKL